MDANSVNSAIVKLEALDPKDEYVYERAIMAFLAIKDLPILAIDLTPRQIPFVCRTRTHDTPDLFKKISDVSIPPSSAIKGFARCNRPAQPVFYCSQNQKTSYSELVENWVKEKTDKPKLYVTIGRWELKNQMKAVIITTPNASKRVSDFDKKHGPALDEFISKQSNERKEALNIFYHYLWEKFRKKALNDPKTYIITTAYSNIVLMQTKFNVNAIYYPSVPLNGQGINFAINSKFACYENLVPTFMLQSEFSITPIANGTYDFTQTNSVSTNQIDIENDKIIW